MDLNLSLNIVQGSSRDATKSEGKQKHKLKRKKLMEINERKKNRSGRLNKQRPNRSHATSNPIYSANFEKIKERRAQRKAGVIKDRDHLAQKAIQSEFDSGIVEEKLPKLSVIDKPASDRTESFEKVRNNQPTTSTRNQDRPTHSYGIFERTNKSRFNRDGGEDFARNGTKKSIKSSDREDKSLNKSSQPDEDILQSILGIANRSVPKESNHDLSVPNPTVGFEGLDEFSAGLDRPAKKRPMAGDRPVKKFLSEEEYFEKREREMEEEMSKLTDEDRNKLKNDFNRMFSNKGSIDYDAASFEVFKKPSAKPIQDTPRERRLSTVALFKNNPDIPEFTL